MTMPIHMPYGAVILAAAVATVAAASSPAAAGHGAPGEWVDGHASRARLVQGPRLATGEQIVGVHIELDPGWHTYWRNPGDSGVPPYFDWSRSANVASVVVEYPAPKALDVEFGTSIGYKDEVVFPAIVKPEDADGPVSLVLDLDYAVCAEICVPLRAELTAELTEDQPAVEAIGLVSEYHRKVPRRQAAASDRPPAIEKISTKAGERGMVLDIAARGALPADLFVEGPSSFYFPAAKGEAGGGEIRFRVEVDGAREAGDLAGAELTATLVSADGAVEYSWTAK